MLFTFACFYANQPSKLASTSSHVLFLDINVLNHIWTLFIEHCILRLEFTNVKVLNYYLVHLLLWRYKDQKIKISKKSKHLTSFLERKLVFCLVLNRKLNFKKKLTKLLILFKRISFWSDSSSFEICSIF